MIHKYIFYVSFIWLLHFLLVMLNDIYIDDTEFHNNCTQLYSI